jgi:hypothetical protein
MVQQHQISLIAPYTHQALTSMKTIPKPPDTRGGAHPGCIGFKESKQLLPLLNMYAFFLFSSPCLHSVAYIPLLFIRLASRSFANKNRQASLSVSTAPPSHCGFNQPRGGEYDSKNPRKTQRGNGNALSPCAFMGATLIEFFYLKKILTFTFS